jgi:hypothetical protein
VTRTLQVGRKEEMKERGRVEEKAREGEIEQRGVGVGALGGAVVGVWCIWDDAEEVDHVTQKRRMRV